MNKKGFAATGILYTILVLFILLFSGMLTMLYSRNNILIQIQNEIKGNAEDSVITYDVYQNGTPVYFNPETGNICDESDAISTTGTKKGCMKWYIFNDNMMSSYVNMILDHNTTASTAWNLSGTNIQGPDLNFLEKLRSDTSGWIGVPLRSDGYVHNGYKIDYSGYRARIISAEEIAQITNYVNWNDNWYYFDSNSTSTLSTCNSDNTSNCNYGWLYDRTNITCMTYGCLNNSDVAGYGYWTSTSRSGEYYTKMAWRVHYEGILDCNVNYSTIEKENGNFGIRPVITIDKSRLK